MRLAFFSRLVPTATALACGLWGSRTRLRTLGIPRCSRSARGLGSVGQLLLGALAVLFLTLPAYAQATALSGSQSEVPNFPSVPTGPSAPTADAGSISSVLSGSMLGATSSAGLSLHVHARAEVGNEPTITGGNLDHLKTLNGALPLTNTQITGRLPAVSVALEEIVMPGVGVRLSGDLTQQMHEPITNGDQEDAFQQRQQWRLHGYSGQKPLYFGEIADAYLAMTDPTRHGGMELGQFRIPFTFGSFSTLEPPLAIAPEETPMTDLIAARGAVDYQPSTLVWRRDIGIMLFGQGNNGTYMFGVFNGSGPNRLDDNGDKDLFARLDWKPAPNQGLGVSTLVGNDVGYPGGLAPTAAVSPVPVQRRMYGVHAFFDLFRIHVKAEWLQSFEVGLDHAPRRGWYVDLDGPLSSSDDVYAQYSDYTDPSTPIGPPYHSNQVAIGEAHEFAPGLKWRTEMLWRWEQLGKSVQDSYPTYLTGVEMTL